MMEQMTKSELKTGMHVVLRNGAEMVVMNGGINNQHGLVDLHGATSQSGTWCDLEMYNEDMTHRRFEYDSMSEFDIVKVYNIPIHDEAVFKDIKDNHDYDCMIVYVEEAITREEAEQKLGVRIVD